MTATLPLLRSDPTYPDGQCTRFVADHWSDPVGPYWGNGAQWLASAQAAGFPTGDAPEVGAIAVWGANTGGTLLYGHVAIVIAINPLVVDESNWSFSLREDTRAVSPQSMAGIIGYIYPKGNPLTDAERLDIARALARLSYAAAGHRVPESQTAEDFWASVDLSKVASFDYMVRDVLSSPEMVRNMAEDAARDAPASA